MHVAVFDLDHTLSRHNVSFSFGRYLHSKRALSLLQAAHLVASYAGHMAGILSLERLHRVAFDKIFYQEEVGACEAVIDAFFANHWDELVRQSVASMLRAHQEQGDLVWIQSSSPLCLVQSVASRLQVSMVSGTTYAADPAGRYLEVEQVLSGEGKVRETDDFLRRCQIPAERLTVYSDGIQDLSLLELAGRAVVVNPAKKLRRIAMSRGWEIREVT